MKLWKTKEERATERIGRIRRCNHWWKGHNSDYEGEIWICTKCGVTMSEWDRNMKVRK